MYLNWDVSMNYETYKLAENVRIEEDSDGQLWLVTVNEANNSVLYYPTLSDENGRHLGYDDDFDMDKKVGYGITLKQKRIDLLIPGMTSYPQEHRIKLDNIKEKNISEIFYYDDKTNTEYLLWEAE